MVLQLMAVATPFTTHDLQIWVDRLTFRESLSATAKVFVSRKLFFPSETLFTSPSFKQTLLLDWNAMNIDGNVCNQFDMGFYAMVTLENYSFRNMTTL